MRMRKIHLTKEQRTIEQSLEEFVPVTHGEYRDILQAVEARKKSAVLNIRVNKFDLENIKKKANKFGFKYQTFISEILHRVAQA